jgi:hypothetical protein
MLINVRKVLSTGLAAIALSAVLSVLLARSTQGGVAVGGPGNLGATEVVCGMGPVSESMKIFPTDSVSLSDRQQPHLTGAAHSVCWLPEPGIRSCGE